jgi:hypothetical protein
LPPSHGAGRALQCLHQIGIEIRLAEEPAPVVRRHVRQRLPLVLAERHDCRDSGLFTVLPNVLPTRRCFPRQAAQNVVQDPGAVVNILQGRVRMAQPFSGAVSRDKRWQEATGQQARLEGAGNTFEEMEQQRGGNRTSAGEEVPAKETTTTKTRKPKRGRRQ